MKTRIKNAFFALKRIIGAVLRRDNLLVDEATVVNRESVCKQCPSREPETNQRMECKCFLSLKVQLTTERCPLGKWKV